MSPKLAESMYSILYINRIGKRLFLILTVFLIFALAVPCISIIGNSLDSVSVQEILSGNSPSPVEKNSFGECANVSNWRNYKYVGYLVSLPLVVSSTLIYVSRRDKKLGIRNLFQWIALLVFLTLSYAFSGLIVDLSVVCVVFYYATWST